MLDKMHHISEKEFKLINWLPTSERVDQSINIITHNFINNTCPYYLNEIFDFAPHCRVESAVNFIKLKNPGDKLVPLYGAALLKLKKRIAYILSNITSKSPI